MRIIIYGIGKRYYYLIKNQEYVDIGFLKNRIKVIGFADRNIDIIGNSLMYENQQFVVKDIGEFDKEDFDKVIVTTKKHFSEIKGQMLRIGIKEEKILLIDDIFEFNSEYINYNDASYLNEQWVKIYRMGKNVRDFLETRNYKNVAVYGDEIFAEYLIKELRQSNVSFRHWSSQDTEAFLADVRLYGEKSELPLTDLIIVVSFENYMDIERRLCEMNCIEVISIQELIYRSIKYFGRE